uniref:Uncharacterized protein n=1 Tax=Parascaris equorum TaxID=6256 RepID=A0A914R7C2_PAREQ
MENIALALKGAIRLTLLLEVVGLARLAITELMVLVGVDMVAPDD